MSFKLDIAVVDSYKNQIPPFGYNGLGELVYRRTYSRVKSDGTKEQWYETVERVVNGCYSVQKDHILKHNLGWNESKAQKSAAEMYDLMFNMKMLPPGRGLWMMGTDFVKNKGSAALNNCAFVSTKNLDIESSLPFEFCMDMLMNGVGVGFDLKGAEQIDVTFPESSETEVFVIPDSREGWVDSVGRLLAVYFTGAPAVKFDYSKIRKAGEPIKGFGGIASGSGPLEALHENIVETLTKNIGFPITSMSILDIFNHIACCVVAGNIRRSALIAIGEDNDIHYIEAKNYDINPHRESFGWSSNNSVFVNSDTDFVELAKRTAHNGEPGYIFLDNARSFGRTGDISKSEPRLEGVNPCGEQFLESYELCNLVEIFLNRIDSEQEFNKCIKYAYLYAKSVTLIPTHWALTNRVMLRNRRIGMSVSGVRQFVASNSMKALKDYTHSGYNLARYYDDVYSDWLCVPRSVKITTVKPSGSISLLAGATPGIHFPINRFYIRRVRLAKDSELVQPLINAGYHVEKAKFQEDSTVVVEFPIDCGKGMRAEADASIWEQSEMVVFMQQHWSDNAVSNTITFDAESEAKHISHILEAYQFKVKSLSFLPRSSDTFPQMPYETITENRYNEMMRNIKPVNYDSGTEDAQGERFCDGDSCTL